MLLQRLVPAILFAISVCGANTFDIVVTGLPSVHQNGTYNGFVTATINGIPNQLLLCDDSAHTTQVPSGDIIFDFSDLTGPNALQYARFVTPPLPPPPNQNDLHRYEAAAVMLYELVLAGPSASADLVTDYQYAIWNLFSPSETSLFRPNQTTIQNNAVNVALGNLPAPTWLNTAYKELEIFTPTAAFDSNQEFLALDPGRNAPEPAMGPLVALLLSSVAIARRIRRRHA